MIISIMMILIVLHLFPTFKFQRPITESLQITIEIEDIPVTRQIRFNPPPSRPVVPIPSEDESIPTDETIVAFEQSSQFNSIFDNGISGFGIIPTLPARLLKEVIPEYPQEDYRRGVTGIIKLHVHINENGDVTEVVVLENTTKSELCAEAAKLAALKCKYQPARRGKEYVSSWMSRVIKFEIDR